MKYNYETGSRVLTLLFPGDILSTNAATLREEVTEALESIELKYAPWETLRLDLRSAKMVDSVGLNLIVTLVKTTKNRGGKVVAQIGSANVQRAFVFTRLNSQMELEMAA